MNDPYLWPGTQVLRNRLGEHDQHELDRLERLITTVKADGPPALRLTSAGYRALHRHLFEDIYDWAGRWRTVDMSKNESMFCLARFVAPQMDIRFRNIARDISLRSRDPARFSATAAMHANELNAIHPFREGNGRVLRLFLKLVARRAGFDLRIARIDADEWMRASARGFLHSDFAPLADVIVRAIILWR